MNIPVRPELPTAALRSSQATHAAVDNSAPLPIRPESTYKSGKAVQKNGATSLHPLDQAATVQYSDQWVMESLLMEPVRPSRLVRDRNAHFF